MNCKLKCLITISFVGLLQVLIFMVLRPSPWHKVLSKTFPKPGVIKRNASGGLKNIYFLRIPKTASSVTYAILSRYAMKQKLNWTIYQDNPYRPYNVKQLVKAHAKKRNDSIIRNIIPKFHAGQSTKYNVLADRSLYNRIAIKSVLQTPISYISFIRDPLQQFKSHAYQVNSIEGNDDFSFEEMLYDLGDTVARTTKDEETFVNVYAMAFGFPKRIISDNDTSFIKHLDHIKSVFFIGLTEDYTKSLLLMKRRFYLEWKDIIFVKLHVTDYKNLPAEDDKKLRDLFCKVSPLDCYIYNDIKELHMRSVEQAGKDLQEEEKAFNKVLQRIENYCQKTYSRINNTEKPVAKEVWSRTPLRIERTPWSKSFEVSPKTCALMRVESRAFRSYFYLKQNWSECKGLKRCPVINYRTRFMECRLWCKYANYSAQLSDIFLYDDSVYSWN